MLAAVQVACGGGGSEGTPTPGLDQPATVVAQVRESPTPAATPTPQIVRRDIRATRLVIPSLAIDSRVGTSEVIPYLDVPPRGCPGEPEDTTTLTVPNSGITTPADNLEGLENKAWVLGHSRWAGVNQLLYALQDINVGDEVIIDGVDRTTGEALTNQRFIVDAIYLTDIESGETLVNATGPQDFPRKPTVILQTSVREQSTTQWILNRQKVTSKANNLVEGSLDDPCKYLVLFVYATAA